PAGPAHLPPPTGPAHLPPPSGPAHQLPPPPEVAQVGDWRQLNARMLLVNPVRTLVSLAVPILIAIFGIGQGMEGEFALRFGALFAGLAVAFGLIPWFTTRYRFTETQLQVRRGLLNRTLLTAPLERVRSVDLESSVLHRLLGLSKVKVGTGVDDTRIELDALSHEEAAELQQYLLRRSAVVPDLPAGADEPAQGEHPVGEGGGRQAGGQDTELARIDWSWLRFAPFSLSSLAIVAGILGVGSQFFRDIEIDVAVVQDTWQWLLAQAIVVVAGSLLLLGLVGWVVLSTLNYVVQWWNLRLVRQPGGTLRLTRGLFTTRSTTVEEARVRGVRMTEPLLLRSVRGAELFTLATGVGSGGTTKVLPPCPREVAQHVGHTVLQEDGPLTARLRQHGPASRRRQLVQAQWTTVFFTIPVIGLTWWLDWSVWVPVATVVGLALASLVIGQQEYRNLGHHLTDTHLVSGSGALLRQRSVLERAGIIGWVVRQSFFQRQRGLATLVATTAAGPESVEVVDVPLEIAVAVADAATPDLLSQFAARDATGSRV
nr:PH domain-containing protein [Actinomycetota bacterium]